MVYNPERKSRGGDVPGETKTDNEWGVGRPIEVAEASYEPGYPLGETLDYYTMADVKQGYASYGVAVGEARPKGIIGGRK